VNTQLTHAELRILKPLPASTYLQMAETLDVSRNTGSKWWSCTWSPASRNDKAISGPPP
jgi:hypothetical protein